MRQFIPRIRVKTVLGAIITQGSQVPFNGRQTVRQSSSTRQRSMDRVARLNSRMSRRIDGKAAVDLLSLRAETL